MKIGISAFCASIALLGASTCYGATSSTGKIIVRIEDGAASRCINSTTDKITMNLRKVVIKKVRHLFSEDSTAALVLNTTISGGDNQFIPKKVSFPRMYAALIKNYSHTLVSVPIEEKLFSNFALNDDSGNRYDSTEIEFSLLAFQSKNEFGAALSSLADITKSLPLPINPFSEGFKFFSDYASKVVDATINSENNIAATAKEGKIVLSFSSNDTCTGDQERTGTLAVISGMRGQEEDGVVDIGKEYCWAADLRPVFTLKYAVKEVGAACPRTNTESYKAIKNPHMAFYLNAEIKRAPNYNANISRLMTPPLTKGVTLDGRLGSIYGESSRGIYRVAMRAVPSETSSNSVNVLSESVQFEGREQIEYLSSKIRDNLKVGNLHWHKLKKDSSGQVEITTTGLDGVAIDIAESLKRCAAHGLVIRECM